MCKTWCIRYGCGHIFTFRLSTCRGTFHHHSKELRKQRAACSGSPTFEFSFASACGKCSLERVLAPCSEECARLSLNEGGSTTEDNLTEAELALDECEYVMRKQYPTTPQRLKMTAVPGPGSRTTSHDRSPLRNEILPEDIPERYSDSGPSEDGWIDDDARGWYRAWTDTGKCSDEMAWKSESDSNLEGGEACGPY